MKVWDVLKERKVFQLKGAHKDAIRSVSLSYEGATLVSAGKDGVLTIWGQGAEK